MTTAHPETRTKSAEATPSATCEAVSSGERRALGARARLGARDGCEISTSSVTWTEGSSKYMHVYWLLTWRYPNLLINEEPKGYLWDRREGVLMVKSKTFRWKVLDRGRPWISGRITSSVRSPVIRDLSQSHAESHDRGCAEVESRSRPRQMGKSVRRSEDESGVD